MTDPISMTPNQQEAIDEIHRNLQIIACAGSGKTEVITRRIANILKKDSSVTPKNIVAFTFTEKAAESMKNRIQKALGDTCDLQGMYVGTIHSFCYHLLNQYTDRFSSFRVLDTVKSHLFTARYSNECGMSDLGLSPDPRNISLFLSCIEKLIDDWDNRNQWEETHRTVLEKYKNCLYHHGYIDFSLLIFETLTQINSSPSMQNTLKNIRYLVVDEYQDVDDLQEKLIRCVAAAGANICVVGDDDQTIYQFRGSNADNMISFSQRYPNVHPVQLEENFRCCPAIVDIADHVIEHNKCRLSKKMRSCAGDSSGATEALRSDTQDDQYKEIGLKIQALHSQGIPYQEIAILVRKGKYINAIASQLKSMHIPVETDSAEHFFQGNYFSRFVTTLQILDKIDQGKLYTTWQDITDRQKFNIGFRYLRSCSRGTQRLLLQDILQGFCDKICFLAEDSPDLERRKIDLSGMLQILSDYEEIYGDWQLSARISGILKFLGTQAASEYKYHSFEPKNSNFDAVQLMTVHKSKGLEFHTVFLPELEKREFPVSMMGGKQYWHVLGGTFSQNKEKYQSNLEDERKLFYVAVTRAKHNLYMTYHLSSQSVSCFVKEAALSSYLKIDEEDLTYNPKDTSHTFAASFGVKRPSFSQDLSQQEYWATVQYAKSQLYDYYGTACHFFPGACGDLARIKSMSPAEILNHAHKNRLI